MLLLAAIAIFGPKYDFWENREEVLRVSSSERKIDAVLIETNGGATTSFGYEVYLVASGEKIEGKSRVVFVYGATRNENAYGVNLKWKTSNLLSVEYYKDKDNSKEIRTPIVVNNSQIEVVVHSGVLDPTAPSGGMGYNLRGANMIANPAVHRTLRDKAAQRR